MLINPAPGALVRDPVTKLPIEDGRDVDENDPYWARAIVDGDVVPAPASTPVKATAPKPIPAADSKSTDQEEG